MTSYTCLVLGRLEWCNGKMVAPGNEAQAGNNVHGTWFLVFFAIERHGRLKIKQGSLWAVILIG